MPYKSSFPPCLSLIPPMFLSDGDLAFAWQSVFSIKSARNELVLKKQALGEMRRQFLFFYVGLLKPNGRRCLALNLESLFI